MRRQEERTDRRRGGRGEYWNAKQALRIVSARNHHRREVTMLTVKEAAKKAGVSQSLVYAWCHEERLPHYRLGAEGKRGRIAIHPTDLERFLEACKTERHALLTAGD